jgi:hypothetical protein
MYRYRVRIRGSMFLWGSAGIIQNIAFPNPLVLHIRNDDLGEDVTLGTLSIDGTRTTIGVLSAGQAISIPIQDISGVFANCALDSSISCAIASF